MSRICEPFVKCRFCFSDCVSVKIITDENIEIEIVIALREAGYDVTDIKEVNPGIDDSAVLSLARELKRCC